MENKIVTRSLKRQLNLVVLHEQVENGALPLTTISMQIR
jgi:hypothetical protein